MFFTSLDIFLVFCSEAPIIDFTQFRLKNGGDPLDDIYVLGGLNWVIDFAAKSEIAHGFLGNHDSVYMYSSLKETEK